MLRARRGPPTIALLPKHRAPAALLRVAWHSVLMGVLTEHHRASIVISDNLAEAKVSTLSVADCGGTCAGRGASTAHGAAHGALACALRLASRGLLVLFIL